MNKRERLWSLFKGWYRAARAAEKYLNQYTIDAQA